MNAEQVYLNIPAASTGPLFSWDQSAIEQVLRAAYRVIREVGLRVEDREGVYLKEAESKGAKVDFSDGVVRFTDRQIDSAVARMRETWPASDPACPPTKSERGRGRKFLVGNGANTVFHWPSWTARPPAASDLIDICNWAQGCDDIEAILHPGVLADVDERLEPLYNYGLTSKYCRKRVIFAQPFLPIHVRYLPRMSEVMEARRGTKQPLKEIEWIRSPLFFDWRALRTLMERIDTGACPIVGVGTMTERGMNSPVTVGGLLVVMLAETLSALSLIHLLRPSVGLRTGVVTGSFDFRTARMNFFSARGHIQNLAGWEMLIRGLGIRGTCLNWYREANEPGMQALYEFGMNQAFFSCVHDRCIPELGGLACGSVFSPEQAMLDMETVREFDELTCGFEISPEALGVDEIIAAGHEAGHHMASEHTLRHMDKGVPLSGFFFRGLGSGAEHDRDNTQTHRLLEKAAEEVEAAKARGRDMAPDCELGNELYEFVKEAAAEIGVKPPPLA